LIKKSSKLNVEKAILEFIGILGYGKSGIKFIRSDKTKKSSDTILAVNRKELNKIKASLVFKKIQVSKVSGTLKGLLGKK